MKPFPRHIWLGVLFVLLPVSVPAGSTSVHTSWLWHLHQPIYWPDRAPYNHAADHYQNAWDTIQLGNVHPDDTSLTTVFGEADRVNAYQGEPSSTVSGLIGYPNAGAQVNYSGALMENVQSLAAAGQLGYAVGWNNGNATARTWTTSSGKPRMDLLNFTYHHAMAPLVSDETLEMELRIHQRQMQIFWGTNVPLSRGYFPAETCFSERMIPILNKVGVAWAVVANNHLTRSCADFPLILGSGGENCDIPNPADQLNPAQGAGNYQTLSISRGCSPTAAMPFAYQIHYARYVDPATGIGSSIMVVPADQALGWDDSYSTWNVSLMNGIQARNNPSKPAIVLLAHDGDNAWSGGNTYYTSWANQFAGEAAAAGYEPSTVEQFLAENPPDTNDVVHVEDGGWVFADSDFGSPSYINWNWPPSYTDGSGNNVVDPSAGVTDKGDNWRVIIATENRVKTAQQVSGISPNIDQVRDPGSFSGTPNGVELGWHYYLASLDSGFVYFGCTGDECLRAIVAQSNACRNVDVILSTNQMPDATPPTVFLPQRHPWNPGGTNFGVQYGYKVAVATNTDFWVWTYAYDVSGITNASLIVRTNGGNAPNSDQFKTYAGGPLTGPWQISSMTKRVTPDSSGYTPQYIADYYYSMVTGITNSYVDYYVSATDAHGNTYNSPIQHVWVGAGSGAGGGAGGGGSGPVTVSPNPPGAGNLVTIQYVAAGRGLASANPVYLHLGWNSWSPVVSPDPAMTFNSASNWWQFTAIVPTNATTMNCAFNNGSGTWDNNSGANWNFTVNANSTPQPPPAPASLTASIGVAGQINLSWPAAPGATGYIINRGGAPLATDASTNYSDTEVSLGSSYCYTVEATNSIGDSATSESQCITLQAPGTPAGLTAVAVSSNQINLSWSAVAGAGGYVVSRDTIPIAATAGTNYFDTPLATDSLHCYTVTATNDIGDSTPSASECATTLTNKITGSYGAMSVAGTFLNPIWNAAASNMVEVASDNWQCDVTLTNATNFQFKFVANGNWTTNWGVSSQSQFTVPLSGTAQAGAGNIQANGSFNGAYRFAFNDQTLAYSLTPLLASPWASMALAGTFNGWSTTSNHMTLVTNDQWQCNLPFNGISTTSPSNILFKFAANGNWATNWGASNEVEFPIPFGAGLPTSDTAQFYGSNITATLGESGAYLFTFNDQSLAYGLHFAVVGAFPPTLVPALSAGGIMVSFTNVSGSGFTAFGSTNLAVPLSNWTVLGAALETSPGMYQLTNTPPSNTPCYFYRVRFP